ncbi:MAG: alkylmercury lyase family protein [Proteobacteria bacterium]|nr:alkylmercury lyase family protein [Pseudomonadota bacterium]
MQGTTYSDSLGDIQSIASRLTAVEQLVRDSVMEQIIAKGGPVTAFDLKQVATLHSLDVEEQLAALIKKRTIVVSTAGFITFSYPVSALPTHHRVTLADGRSFHAMCAVDALGTAFTFNQNIMVDSQCSRCRQPVHLAICDQQIMVLQPAETRVLHVDLSLYDNWSGNC